VVRYEWKMLYKPRTARALCQKWVQDGFFIATDTSRKGRKYRLGSKYESLLQGSWVQKYHENRVAGGMANTPVLTPSLFWHQVSTETTY
jgi:hypothetical protein